MTDQPSLSSSAEARLLQAKVLVLQDPSREEDGLRIQGTARRREETGATAGGVEGGGRGNLVARVTQDRGGGGGGGRKQGNCFFNNQCVFDVWP